MQEIDLIMSKNIYTKRYKTQTGVYEIKNKINGKRYIGSTSINFNKRLVHHLNELRRNNHKNVYLQNSWNKYGEYNFEFNILEVVDKCRTLEVEQSYLDTLKPEYNINPLATGTPNLVEEVIEKRTKSFSLFMKEAMNYFRKVKNKEITIDKVPLKYVKVVESRLTFVPWNKGKDDSEIDYNYLKGVPKTKTDKLKEAHRNTSERSRERSPNVFVYDLDMNFIGEWRSSKDLEEFSMTEENKLPIVLGKVGNRRPHKYLSSGNIMKVFDKDKTYKGLYFKSSKIN